MQQSLVFNDEILFYRKRISEFDLSEVEAMVFYFSSTQGFYCPAWGDYVELQSINDKWKTLKKLLMKDFLTINDIGKLVLVAGIVSDHYLNSIAELERGLIKEFEGININQLYFSVYYIRSIR